jgi:hypothetical protein
VNPGGLSGLIAQLAAWVKSYASGYKLVLFKDVKPSSTEERILAETGKTLFLPSTLGDLPKNDPFPKKRLITEEMFRRYLESTGVDPNYLDEGVSKFIKNKFDAGFFSDAWVPILFHEYVLGYIHIWINKEGKKPFDYDLINSMYQFGSVLAFSLKQSGYFDSGRLGNNPFQGKIVDISASGMLFTYPHSSLSSALLPETELAVKLVMPKRTVNASAKILRRYKDNIQVFFGCQFMDMVPEDMRFFFEHIYGKPFDEVDASFLTGQV